MHKRESIDIEAESIRVTDSWLRSMHIIFGRKASLHLCNIRIISFMQMLCLRCYWSTSTLSSARMFMFPFEFSSKTTNPYYYVRYTIGWCVRLNVLHLGNMIMPMANGDWYAYGCFLFGKQKRIGYNNQVYVGLETSNRARSRNGIFSAIFCHLPYARGRKGFYLSKL